MNILRLDGGFLTHTPNFNLWALLILGLFFPLRSGAETEITGPTQPTGPSQGASDQRVALNAPQLPKLRIAAEGLSDDEMVAKLLAAMTLEEKVGQLSQVFPGGDPLSENDTKAIAAGRVGSVFYTGNNRQAHEAQRVAVEESRLGIPLLIARDVIHGFHTVFPIPLGQAASWNPELVKRAAQLAAQEARHAGIHWTFAPMVDIARDPRWGRIAESCGEDPVLASVLGRAMVEGFQSIDAQGHITGLAACPKHYVAYGLAEGGRDYNRALISRNELRNVHLRPFKACIDAGAATLMSGFNSVNGVPATAHDRLLRDVLKREWKFPGFVVSDWASIAEMRTHGYAAKWRDAAALALRAGIDMEMASTTYRDHLRSLLAEDRIQMEMIDEAVRRILHAKLRLDLFNSPYAESDQPELDSAEYRQVAKELAQQSIVLLKNEDQVLPLKGEKVKRIAVIGPYADAGHDQLGTWVMDGKREWSVTPLAALKEALGDQVELKTVACSQIRYAEPAEAIDQEMQQAINAAKWADLVLLFVGEDEAWSGEAHSRVELSLPGRQSELVTALAELPVPVVMTVSAGRPLTIGTEVEAVDAVLYAWQGGMMAGPALVELLLGNACPSGKLPVTFPKAVGQIPLYYNHPNTGRPSPADYQPPSLKDVVGLHHDIRYTSHYIDSDPFPLFLFGFGLTYTNFAYYDLEIESSSIQQGQDLRVRVRVGNGGNREAVETVQVYTRDRVASVVRPVKELKAFRRISLRPGESRIVEFTIPYKELGFFNEAEEYLVEPGEFEVAVGGSSATQLSAMFLVE